MDVKLSLELAIVNNRLSYERVEQALSPENVRRFVDRKAFREIEDFYNDVKSRVAAKELEADPGAIGALALAVERGPDQRMSDRAERLANRAKSPVTAALGGLHIGFWRSVEDLFGTTDDAKGQPDGD